MNAVEQEASMPSALRLRGPSENPPIAGAHLSVVWWHQRTGEPDEFARIAFDTVIDSSTADVVIPFSSLERPFDENLICWRACRDRSICSCETTERFALGSVLIAIDRDGSGALSLDEIRSEQIAGTRAVIGWSPVAVPNRLDAPLVRIHQGFAAYLAGDDLLLDAVTSDVGAAATLAFCAPGDAACTYPIQRIFCLEPTCHPGSDWGLNRLGLR